MTLLVNKKKWRELEKEYFIEKYGFYWKDKKNTSKNKNEEGK